MKPFKASCWPKFIEGGIFLLIGLWAVTLWIRGEEPVPLLRGGPHLLLQALICVVWSVYIFAIHGHIEITTETIRVHTIWGHHQIRWDEIERIETAGASVLHGAGKKLVLPDSISYSGRDGFHMRGRYVQQISARGIPVTQTWNARFQISRGTRVKI